MPREVEADDGAVDAVDAVDDELVINKVLCNHCNELVNPDDTRNMISPANEVWCDSCFESDGNTCGDCGDHTDESLQTVFQSQGSNWMGRRTVELEVCDNCYNNDTRYSACDRCNDMWRALDLSEWAGDNACRRCWDNDAYTCDDCGAERWGGDDHYIHCEGSDDDRDGSDSDFIYSYDYDVTRQLNFLGNPKDKLYLGVELEVEIANGYDRDRQASAVASAMNGFAILKSDGSLDEGFEIVSAPASIAVHREQWTERFYGKKFLKGLRSWDTTTCGLHIHISRKPISKLTQAKIVGFCNIPENRVWMEKLAGRNDCYYAKFKDVEQLGRQWKYQSDRYRVVNVDNEATLEFRIFKGSLRPERLWRALEFVHSLVKFCEQASVEGLQASKYLEWLGKRKKEYPALAEFYYPKVARTDPNPKQRGLFTAAVADGCVGDDAAAAQKSVYDPNKELAEQRERERIECERRAAEKLRKREARQRANELAEARRQQLLEEAAQQDTAAFRLREQRREELQRGIDNPEITLVNSWADVARLYSGCSCSDCTRDHALATEMIAREEQARREEERRVEQERRAAEMMDRAMRVVSPTSLVEHFFQSSGLWEHLRGAGIVQSQPPMVRVHDAVIFDEGVAAAEATTAEEAATEAAVEPEHSERPATTPTEPDDVWLGFSVVDEAQRWNGRY